MTPELTVLLLAVVAGIALAWQLDRRAAGSLLAGEAFLLGIAATAGVLFLLALVRVPWSSAAFTSGVVVVIGAGWYCVARSYGGEVSTRWSPRPAPRHRAIVVFAAAALNAFTVALVAGYAVFATVAPMWEFDFLGDFGFKARTFWESRTIDWSFLEQASHRVVHPDYPPLLPLAFDSFAVLRGGWNDSAVGLISVAFAVALLLAIHRIALEELESPLTAAFLTLAMVPFACSPWIGLAEGPLVAYGTAGLLLIRRGSVMPGAVMLGLAASTKNEGLTLVVAAALALAIDRRIRELPRLWPALVIPLPWLVLRRLHGLHTDITEGSVVLRVLAHLRDPRPLIEALGHYSLGKPWFWIALAIAVVIAFRPLLARERFVFVALTIQLAFYIGAYLATPHELDWQVRWSWDRLISHLTPALTYVVLATLLNARWTSARLDVKTSG
jgi:hypothetical protein